MALKTRHIYLAPDYPEGCGIPSSRRLHFGAEAAQIRGLIGLPEESVLECTGALTVRRFRQVLGEFLGPSSKGAEVLIYFTGHAELDSKLDVVYLRTADTHEAGLPTFELLEIINRAHNPARIGVILDCCHSGCPGTLNRGRVWLAACERELEADEQFHHALIECLEMPTDTEGISIQSIYDHIRRKVIHPKPELAGILSEAFAIKRPENRHGDDSTDLERIVTEIVTKSLSARGRLRTAFPTDYSFAELYREEIYLQPTVSRSPQSDCETQCDIEMLANEAASGKSLLILGEPGSGKSFISYILQSELLQRQCKAIALDLLELIDGSETPRGYVAGKIMLADDGLMLLDDVPIEGATLLLDSIDEVLADPSALPESAVTKLDQTLGRNTVVALCRRREYETDLYKILGSEAFDSIYYMVPWRVDHEFQNYMKILADRGFPNVELLLETVNRDEALQNLVSRPLLSRMLCFVWSQEGATAAFTDIKQRASLYRAYLTCLAKMVDVKIARAFTNSTMTSESILKLWKEQAWQVHHGSMLVGGVIRAEDFDRLLSDCAPQEVYAFRSLIQTQGISGQEGYAYMHYSFFEFLVAYSFTDELVSSIGRDDESSRIALLHAKDFSQEVRHHCMDLLRLRNFESSAELAGALARTYRFLRQDGDEVSKMTSCNLIVYWIGRLKREQSKALVRELISEETNGFLRESLYWAACHLDDFELFFEFVELLNEDSQMAALNRGYLLYYYGDVSRYASPPYLDTDPGHPWGRTRQKTLQMMSEERYADRPFCRKGIDLVTFLSFLRFRNNMVSKPDEHSTLSAILNELLRDRKCTDRIREILIGLAHVVELMEKEQ